MKGGEGKRMRITVYEQNLCFRTSGYYAKCMENEQNPSLTFSRYYGICFRTQGFIKG